MPKVYLVNWFRRDEDGSFLWPGFGENSRVIEWAIRRVEGEADAVDTPIGRAPVPGDFNVDGLDVTPQVMEELFAVNPSTWLYTGAQITVDTSSCRAMKLLETTT
jgi:phosphoenolpyruvate carboxykinase (GTP)